MELPPAFLCLPGPGEKTLASVDRKLRLLALRGLITAPTARLSAELRLARSIYTPSEACRQAFLDHLPGDQTDGARDQRRPGQ